MDQQTEQVLSNAIDDDERKDGCHCTISRKWYLSRLVQQKSEEVHTEIAGERTVRDERLGLDLE